MVIYGLSCYKEKIIFFYRDINYCEGLILCINLYYKIEHIAKSLYCYKMRKTSITKQGILNKKL